MAHKDAFERAPLALLPGAFFGVFAWVLLANLTDVPGLGFFAFIALGLLGIWPYTKAIARARSLLKPCCASEKAAVEYLDWQGTFHTFGFRNRQYLDLFTASNARKTMSDIRVG